MDKTCCNKEILKDLKLRIEKISDRLEKILIKKKCPRPNFRDKYCPPGKCKEELEIKDEVSLNPKETETETK